MKRKILKVLLMILIVILVVNCCRENTKKELKIEIPERTKYTTFTFDFRWIKEEYQNDVKMFLIKVMQRDKERENDIQVREEIIKNLLKK